jgi:hypothetical protein
MVVGWCLAALLGMVLVVLHWRTITESFHSCSACKTGMPDESPELWLEQL